MRPIRWAGAVLMLAAVAARAQEVKPKSTVTLFANLGYESNVSAFSDSLQGLDRTGPVASVRVMWHPQFLLSFGWEVGYTRRFSVKQVGDSTIDQTSGAWPIFFVLSMSPVKRMLVNVGIGPVFSTTSVNALGVTAKSYTGFSSGYMASVAYLAPVSKKFDMGGEFRFLHSDLYNDNLLSLQLTVAYRLSGK
ncbi:MAG TPA: hypothetical protein VMT93_06455 [Gemmatimonadaceae bacterium]|nr:hypothetical protein [Gemmatimonadaceae bacterium]